MARVVEPRCRQRSVRTELAPHHAEVLAAHRATVDAMQDESVVARAVDLHMPRQRLDHHIGERHCAVAARRLRRAERRVAGLRAYELAVNSHGAAQEVDTVERESRRFALAEPCAEPEVECYSKPGGRSSAECIEFRTGARLSISANQATSGHGASLDLVMLDECWSHTDDRAETSFRPPMLTRPQPQLWCVSTAGDDTSVYLRDKVELGRLQAAEGLTVGSCYFEWSAEEDADPSDEATWWSAMPALGKTISVEAVRADQLAMPPGAFARSNLNLWTAGAGEPAINPERWAACADTESDVDGSVAFAIDISPNRESAAIAMSGNRADGRAHIEVVDHRPGVRWVVDRMVELVARWSPSAVALDPVGPAGSLLPRLEDAGIEVTQIGTRELGQACGALFDAVVSGDVRHGDQVPLNAAVAGARKRPLGDAFAWSRKGSSVDISPLVACTLAFHARSAAAPFDSIYNYRGFIVFDGSPPDEDDYRRASGW